MCCEQFCIDFEKSLNSFGFDEIRLIQVSSETTEHFQDNLKRTVTKSRMGLWTAIAIRGAKVIATTVSDPIDGGGLAKRVIESPAMEDAALAEAYRRAFAQSFEAASEIQKPGSALEVPDFDAIPWAEGFAGVESVYAKESTASYRLFGRSLRYAEMTESRNTVQVMAIHGGCRQPLSFRDLSAEEAELFWGDGGSWRKRSAAFFTSKELESMPEGRFVLSVEALRVLMQSVSPLFSVDAYAAEQGLLIGAKLGSKIMGDCVSVYDEPRNPSFPDTYLFDMQGVPTSNRSLITLGRLSGLLGSVEGSVRAHLDYYGNAWSDAADPITLAPMSKNMRICIDNSPVFEFDYKIEEFLPETIFDPMSGLITGRAVGLMCVSGKLENVIFPIVIRFSDIFSNPHPMGQTLFCRGFAGPELAFDLET